MTELERCEDETVRLRCYSVAATRMWGVAAGSLVIGARSGD